MVLLVRTLKNPEFSSLEKPRRSSALRSNFWLEQILLLSNWTEEEESNKKKNKSSHLPKHSSEVEPVAFTAFRRRVDGMSASTMKLISLDMRKRSRIRAEEQISSREWLSSSLLLITTFRSTAQNLHRWASTSPTGSPAPQWEQRQSDSQILSWCSRANPVLQVWGEKQNRCEKRR